MSTTKTTPPAKKAAKRSQSAKFINEAGLPPLRPEDYIDLRVKLERLDTVNHTLIEHSEDVDNRRAELLVAEAALKEAEEDLRAMREEHQTALREVAPLLNRLPTV